MTSEKKTRIESLSTSTQTDTSESTLLDTTTQKNIDMWLNGDIDEKSRQTIQDLLKGDPKPLIDAFYTNLSFGTGGLRGIMGVGTNRMNEYTVRMATQGLANYLKKLSPSNSVFIGYDSRHNSRFFAEEAAKVLAGNKIKVFLCRELRPTPFISFGCRYHHCSAAIMITASHNPAEYNGYKVYWSDGGQVVPPQDREIIAEVNKITDLSMVTLIDNVNHPLIQYIGQELDEIYLSVLDKLPFYSKENRAKGADLSIVYTSLHGTGFTLVPEALKRWGFTQLTLVASQCIPDGSFPTVKSPNPEDKAALQLGIDLLEKIDGDILLGTDPDADRVGVAVMHHGETILLTGNQIACICLYHICEAMKLPPHGAFVKTIATTELFKVIAESYGVPCFNTLIGFKYIAALIKKWEGAECETAECEGAEYKNSKDKDSKDKDSKDKDSKDKDSKDKDSKDKDSKDKDSKDKDSKDKDSKGEHYQFIFGGEESYGYLLGTHARDKDAVIASALICEVASHAKQSGKTLVDLLHEIYSRFGVYYEMLHSINFEDSKAGQERRVNGMRLLRENTPKEINGVAIKTIEDYLTLEKVECNYGKDRDCKETKETKESKNSKEGQTRTKLDFDRSDVLLFWLVDGTKLMIRPSGTEPKIKIYCGVCERQPEHILDAYERCGVRAKDMIEALERLFAS